MRLGQMSDDNFTVVKIYSADPPNAPLVDLQSLPDVREGWIFICGRYMDPKKASTLKAVKDEKLSEIADARWENEVGGIEYEGLKVYTDRDSQAKYTGAIVAYDAVHVLPAAWKCEDGWLPINTIEDLIGLAMAVQQHVQNCYLREGALQQAIAAASTIEAVRAISWGTV